MLKVVTAPTVEPVSLVEAKAQAVIGHDADDALLAMMISAARGNAEALTCRSLAPQTLEVVLDRFPSWEIELPQGPVTAVTSVKYIDIDGDEQTLVAGTDYDTDADSLVARIMPVDGGEWPDTKNTPGSVRVRYAAGWTASNIPPPIKMWILIRVSSLYSQRDAHVVGPGMLTVMPMDRSFADSLLDAYRVQEAP